MNERSRTVGQDRVPSTVVWDARAVAEGLAVTDEAENAVLSSLKGMLDDYHGCCRDESYYRLIAGDWLMQFLHVTYAAWRTVLSGEPVGDMGDVRIVDDLHAFTRETMTVGFHEYWRSAVASLLSGQSPNAWRIDHRAVAIRCGRRNWRKTLVNSALRRASSAVLFCGPYYKCSQRDWLSALWRWRSWAAWDDLDYPVTISCAIDAKWRLDRSATTLPVRDFAGLLKALLPLHVPVALLEGLLPLREAALGLGLPRPRAVHTATALHGHLTFKLLAAEWRGEGTSLLVHQHGGGYGIERRHPLEDYESSVVDRFYSWGWQRHDRPVTPLGAPYPRIDSRRGRGMLVMCGSNPKVPYRLHFQPMPGTTERMMGHTESFLASVAANDDWLVRLARVNDGASARPRLQAAAPWVKFDDDAKPVFDRYAHCWLAVHAYLGTSWLETLAFNIPTICFFDADTYVFRAEAQPYVYALKKVGILHESGFDAARAAESVLIDPQGWWRSADVRAARGAFVQRFANLTPTWAREWETEFRQWAE